MTRNRTTPRRRKRPEQIVKYLQSKGLNPETWPLSPHLATNRWYATLNSTRHYFGPLDGDPNAALARYQHEAPHLAQGNAPPVRAEDGAKLHEIINPWLARQEVRMQRGKIRPSTFSDYRRVAEFMVGVVSRNTPIDKLTPDVWEDYRDAIDDKTSSPSVASRYVVISRQIFTWALKNGRIKALPSYGTEFVVASKAQKREAQQARGSQTFTAEQLRAILDQAPPLVKVATMIACNTGMTQMDISDLRRRDVNADDRIIENLRGKTSMVRRAPLWDETLALLTPYLKGKRAEDRVFLHTDGKPLIFFTDDDPPQRRDRFSRRFGSMMKSVGVKLNQAGFGHVKHSFKTVVSAVNDSVAVDCVVGHEPGKGVDWHYLRDLERHRLDAVVQTMHDWLFGEGA